MKVRNNKEIKNLKIKVCQIILGTWRKIKQEWGENEGGRGDIFKWALRECLPGGDIEYSIPG